MQWTCNFIHLDIEPSLLEMIPFDISLPSEKSISDDNFRKHRVTNFQIIGVWNACWVYFRNVSVQSSLWLWYLEIICNVIN